MISRRSHNKSRHGCSNCKRRRVKCDEQRPFCGNCTQRQDDCVYNAEGPFFFAGKQSRRTRRTGPSSPASEIHSSLSIPGWDASLNRLQAIDEAAESPVLNMEQLQLIIQWVQHTHTFLARNEETRKVWEMAVLEEGLKAPFLMHGILGLSALHLSCTRDSEQARWLSVAISHKNTALSMFSGQLASIDRSNAKAMMGFAGLVVVFGLGSALTPGTDAGPGLDALIEIFTLARGVQAVVNEEFQFLLQSNFAPLFDATPPTIPLPDHVLAAFDRLGELNTQLGRQSVHHDSTNYERTIHHLRDMAAFTLAQPTSMTIVGGWAIRAPSQYMSALNSREPFALVLLAHFCGFLNMARQNWCVGRWGPIVLEEINQLLPSDWQHHTNWPTEQVLGMQHIQSNVSPMET